MNEKNPAHIYIYIRTQLERRKRKDINSFSIGPTHTIISISLYCIQVFVTSTTDLLLYILFMITA